MLPTYIKYDQVGNGQSDADQPDQDQNQLRLELGVFALERGHDAPVAIQRDDDEGVDARVDAHVLM